MTASDRMITAGNIQYEPFQLKLARITKRVAILIAGDYTTHSEAIRNVTTQIKANASAKVFDVALMYGAAIQAVQRRRAEDVILAPLSLNTDTFLAQQKEFSDTFVTSITDQLQGFQGDDVEAIVIGAEDEGAHIYTVDSGGTVRCYDDVGFAAIGIGGSHARSVFMQSKYVNGWNYVPTLSTVYSAKKVAEVAPGVGSGTDIHLIFRTGITQLWPPTFEKVEGLWKQISEARTALGQAALRELQEFVNDPKNNATPPSSDKEKPSQAGTDGGGDSSSEGSGTEESHEDEADEAS